MKKLFRLFVIILMIPLCLIACEELDGNEENNYLIGTKWKSKLGSTELEFISNSKLEKEVFTGNKSDYTYIFDGLKDKGIIYSYKYVLVDYYDENETYQWVNVNIIKKGDYLYIDGLKFYQIK